MDSLPTVTQITEQGSGNIEIDSWSLRRRFFDAIASEFTENHQTRFREDRRLILGLQEPPRLSHRWQMYGSDLHALDYRDVAVWWLLRRPQPFRMMKTRLGSSRLLMGIRIDLMTMSLGVYNYFIIGMLVLFGSLQLLHRLDSGVVLIIQNLLVLSFGEL